MKTYYYYAYEVNDRKIIEYGDVLVKVKTSRCEKALYGNKVSKIETVRCEKTIKEPTKMPIGKLYFVKNPKPPQGYIIKKFHHPDHQELVILVVPENK